MLIRCEKCSTTYELEERLIPPGGAPVQCSRCEHVFRAYPPSRRDLESGSPDAERRPGLELVPAPADDLSPDDVGVDVREDVRVGTAPEPEPEPGARLDEASEIAPPSALRPEPPLAPPYAAVAKTPAPVAAPEDDASGPLLPAAPPPPTSPVRAAPGPTANGPTATPRPSGASTYKPPPGPTIPPGKPVRKVPNPELEGTETASVAPMPRRAVSFDVRPKKRTKSSWIVSGAVGLLLLLAVVGSITWFQDRRAAKNAERAAAAASASASASRAMTRERQDALRLLMRDDAASVERAAALLDEAVRREPNSAARADRALALALLAQQARDQAQRLESRASALEDARTAAAGDAASAARSAELAAEAETARAEVEPLRERAGRLLSEARAELDALPAALAKDASALRARAWVQLVSGQRDEAARTAAAGDDPWLALATVVAELPESAGGEEHARAADRLDQLAAAHADFLRPRFLAGRIRAGLGDGERALANLDAVLRANPQHVEARRIRADIAPMPAAAAEPDEAAPPGRSPAVDGHSQPGKAAAAPRGP